MLRIIASLLTLAGLALPLPAAAQSLGLVAMPVIYVAKPVVQPIEGTKVLAPREGQRVLQPSARPVLPRIDHGADFVGVRPQQVMAVAASPVWQAPPAIDRALRNYRRGIAYYGPFMVLDERRVALVGETDRASPAAFAAMLRDYPGLRQIDMVECPGTRDDIANMKLGRMIRAARLVTHVPSVGSVRSGAVELFFAGIDRDIADGAEFAVHSWMDVNGHEASDFAADAPENRKYLDYYREMGMDAGQARAFYDFTNSVPHASARWLTAGDMRRWARPATVQQAAERPAPPRQPVREATTISAPKLAPKLAYADMTFS